jgi:hypothetical protein
MRRNPLEEWGRAEKVRFQFPTRNLGARLSGSSNLPKLNFLSPSSPNPEDFVPTENYYVVVQLHTHQPALLHCQVTNHLAQVTLYWSFPPKRSQWMGQTSPSM